MTVLILTTAHWHGDARLNRHREYLSDGGFEVSIESYRHLPRPLAIVRVLSRILTRRPKTVILPDPETFFLGGLIGRMAGKRVVIDIHEDYPLVAASRTWIAPWARPAVGLMARFAVRAGRAVAHATVVAAGHLAAEGDLVVGNLPRPDSMSVSGLKNPSQLVYVGDITIARGAVAMIETIAGAPEPLSLLLVGPCSPNTVTALKETIRDLDVGSRVTFAGQLAHKEAWSLAAGSLAGLNLLEPHPAYVDAVGTKVWEYMAVGLPPIVSDLAGIRSVVEQIDVSLVCADIEAVVATAQRLKVDETWREQLVERGRQLVEEKWSASRPDLRLRRAISPGR